jgi:hypothetical protein
MGQRNPIYVVPGGAPRSAFTVLSDETIRVGGHDKALGSDGLALIALLLSRASSSGRPWETSAGQISADFGWGANRQRAQRAIERAVKDGRLIIREYVRDGAIVARKRAYVLCPGGRRFTDEERFQWSTPIQMHQDKQEASRDRHA